MYNYESNRRRSPLLSREELKKFKRHVNRLEGDQRHRFDKAEDNYMFFESEFEREIREEIVSRRNDIVRQIELQKDYALQSKIASTGECYHSENEG